MGGASGKRRSTGVRRGSRRSDPFRYDREQLAHSGAGAHRIAGADEVGRGCLAGPLVAAAVVLDYRKKQSRLLQGLSDSKVLTAGVRQELYGRILGAASRISVIAVTPGRIDSEGLHRCNLAALVAVLERTRPHYDCALVDGFKLDRPDLELRRVNGGDWLSAAIGAASVVAKVTRDRLMTELEALYPGYGFAGHVGYGTPVHQRALRDLGPTPLHRRSFSLVQAICSGEPLTLFDDEGLEGEGPRDGEPPDAPSG